MLFQTPDLTGRQISALRNIGALRTDLRHRIYEPNRWSGSFRRVSFARSVRGSNSIEGYEASLDDVLAEGEGDEVLDPKSETKKAIEGYRNAMTLVLQLADDPHLAFHPMLLRSLQFMMTSYDLGRRPGLWRQGDIFVRDDSSGEVVYEGPDVGEVPALMEELAAELQSIDEDTSAIVRAAMAHLNLAMIHPFRDGNGRMARCLQTLVLAREGVLSPVFCSIEEYLGEHTPDYYAVLAQVGGGHWQPERDATEWVEFVLLAQFRQARLLLLRVSETERLWDRLEYAVAGSRLPERVVAALYDGAIGLRVRNATYRTAHEIPLSDQLASRDLKGLVDAGWLDAHGERRGRHYTRSGKLAELDAAVRADSSPLDSVDPFEA